MISEFKTASVTPHFSALVLVVFVALVAAAVIIGKRSVTIRPYKRSRRVRKDYTEPRFEKKKAEALKDYFGFRYTACKKCADSEIHLCSRTWDITLSIVAGLAFGYTFASEHFRGIEQVIINGQINTDDVLWASVGAGAVCTLITFGAGFGFFVLRDFSENLQAQRYIEAYLAKGRRPVIREARTVSFTVIHLLWAIRRNAEEVFLVNPEQVDDDEEELQKIVDEMNDSFCSIEGSIIPFRKRA